MKYGSRKMKLIIASMVRGCAKRSGLIILVAIAILPLAGDEQFFGQNASKKAAIVATSNGF